tara:strand:- start:309 stop:542 length:234 start_codon:yes stop_codon:yes gene_type:complete
MTKDFYVVIATDYGVIGCWKDKTKARQAVNDYLHYHHEEITLIEDEDNCWNDSATEVVLIHGSKGTLLQIDKRELQD